MRTEITLIDRRKDPPVTHVIGRYKTVAEAVEACKKAVASYNHVCNLWDIAMKNRDGALAHRKASIALIESKIKSLPYLKTPRSDSPKHLAQALPNYLKSALKTLLKELEDAKTEVSDPRKYAFMLTPNNLEFKITKLKKGQRGYDELFSTEEWIEKLYRFYTP